jgi:NO-binding membrane sensor protein with MHYT domain
MDFSLQAGHSVSHSYNAGYVVLSYIVSFSGTWTALELLHRRTSARGLYNWYVLPEPRTLQCAIDHPTCTLLLSSQRYLLLAAASSMGAVAIWSMHFIGNRAIQMASGQAKYQIEYNPGYTAGSFFLPICVVGAAFYFFSTTEKVSVFATLLGGVLTGAAVCGMHYMGQGGISNYVPVYIWGYVLGSALISVTASTAALSIFFYLKSTWTNSWIKRMACASLLATSVSGMHWVAAVGTAYRLKAGAGSSNNGLSRQATVIVVLCLVRNVRPCSCSLRANIFRRHLDVVLPSSSWP